MSLYSLHTIKARVEIILIDINGSEKSLANARENLSEKDTLPFYLSHFLACQFIIDLHRLEESIESIDKANLTKTRKRTLKTGKKLVKITRKVASERVEAYKLMGVYHGLVGKPKRALRWWTESITAGKRIGGRLELSRTYMEVGRRLQESKSKYKKLNGITAKEYLERARTMFQELDLQWDLDELDKIMAAA